MEILIMIGQLILSLSILIVLHEFGHFAPARLFKTRVEKFYLFFDAGFSLFKKKIGETEYGIGWLPLGGYVKISGMIDESFDKEQMEQEPQPWEFRSKPAWQRLIIMLGGVTVNFILGFLLYAMVLFVWGEKFLPAKNVTNGIYVEDFGKELGLQDGDKVLKIGATPFERFNDRLLVKEISINGASTITVNRNGQQIDIPVDPSVAAKLISRENKDKPLFGPRMPFVVGKVVEDMPAEKAGFKEGDSIVGLNGQQIQYFDQFARFARDNKGQTVTTTVIRDNAPVDLTVTFNENGKIGVAHYGIDRYFEMERINYSVGEALPAGFNKGVDFLSTQFKAFGQMFKGNIKVTDSLGGFASIGQMFGDQWIWERFWLMTAVLSLILGFMNLLPIPALDGGYVVFLFYEIISGKKPTDKFMEVANIVGFILVFSLLILANGLDIFHWLMGK